MRGGSPSSLLNESERNPASAPKSGRERPAAGATGSPCHDLAAGDLTYLLRPRPA